MCVCVGGAGVGVHVRASLGACMFVTVYAGLRADSGWFPLTLWVRV